MRLRSICALAVVLSAFLIVSCSSGPKPPKVGTPAFYWGAAKETYAAGDYVKTVQHLDSLLRTDNEYTARARPWLLVLTSGMAKGYMELADHYEFGAKANRTQAVAFRRVVNDYRTLASRLALEFAEEFEKFEPSLKDGQVSLDFAYPTGSAIPTPILKKVAEGKLLQGPQAEDLRKTQLQTAMLQVTSKVVGAGEDQAKAQQLFKAGVVQVPRDVFFLQMAGIMHGNAQLFSRTKLDEPKRMEFFATHALDALKTVAETAESKKLASEIQKTLKLAKTN